jgi:hypothetical protein
MSRLIALGCLLCASAALAQAPSPSRDIVPSGLPSSESEPSSE